MTERNSPASCGGGWQRSGSRDGAREGMAMDSVKTGGEGNQMRSDMEVRRRVSGSGGVIGKTRTGCVLAVLLLLACILPARAAISYQYIYDSAGQLTDVIDSTGV